MKNLDYLLTKLSVEHKNNSDIVYASSLWFSPDLWFKKRFWYSTIVTDRFTTTIIAGFCFAKRNA